MVSRTSLNGQKDNSTRIPIDGKKAPHPGSATAALKYYVDPKMFIRLSKVLDLESDSISTSFMSGSGSEYVVFIHPQQ
jgi:hypothetical protein